MIARTLVMMGVAVTVACSSSSQRCAKGSEPAAAGTPLPNRLAGLGSVPKDAELCVNSNPDLAYVSFPGKTAQEGEAALKSVLQQSNWKSIPLTTSLAKMESEAATRNEPTHRILFESSDGNTRLVAVIAHAWSTGNVQRAETYSCSEATKNGYARAVCER